MTDGLFDIDPAQVRLDETADLSPDQRRKRRQQEAVKGGSHPLSLPLGRHLALHKEAGRSCGNCRFRELWTYHNATYPKCAKEGMPVTHGTATDVRRGWPGCVHHEYESEAADA